MKDIKTFQQMFRDGHMTRRDFFAAMGALGITATTAGGLLTSASAFAATPKKGGRIGAEIVAALFKYRCPRILVILYSSNLVFL